MWCDEGSAREEEEEEEDGTGCIQKENPHFGEWWEKENRYLRQTRDIHRMKFSYLWCAFESMPV